MEDEITLDDKLNAVFNSGKLIRFQNVSRLKESEFFNRIIWEEYEGEPTMVPCKWWGYDTIEEAADNCLNQIIIAQL